MIDAEAAMIAIAFFSYFTNLTIGVPQIPPSPARKLAVGFASSKLCIKYLPDSSKEDAPVVKTGSIIKFSET